MEGYFIGKTGRDWYVCKVEADGPRRVLTGGLVDVVNFMAGVAGEDPIPALPNTYRAMAPAPCLPDRDDPRTYGPAGFVEIGRAVSQKDGSLVLHLAAYPFNGRLKLIPE